MWFSKHSLLLRCLVISTVVTIPSLCQAVPALNVQQTSYSVNAGSSILLQCSIASTSTTVTSVTWQRTVGNTVTTITSTTNTNKYSGSTTTQPSLTIFSTNSGDTGSYVCRATNSAGTGSSQTITLSVITSNVPTVTLPTLAYNVLQGGTITLDCTVSSTLTVTSVRWERNTLGAITPITSTTNTNNCSTVTVQQPSYSVSTGGSVTLVCTVSSPNQAVTSVQWQRNVNGAITTITSIFNTNKYSGSTTTTPSLTIFSAAQSDVGTYTCFATNSVGTGQSSATTLSVTGTVPSVTIQQPSYSVTTGGSVTLVCTVTSNLAITNVQWQRNVNNFVTTITSNTNTNKYSGSTTTTPSLTIFNAAATDAGTYTCFGSNSVGTGQSTTTTLSVTTGTVPSVTIQQPSYSVTTGGSVTLVCTVTSNLAITNVQWQRNIGGSITTITSNFNTNKYSGSTTTTPSLTIFNAASSDAGTYTCFGSNSVGTGQSTTTTLSVTGIVEVGRTFSQNITLPDRNLTQSSWLSESASQITLQKPDINDNITLKYSSAFYRNISDLFHHYILPSGSSEAVNSSYDINSIIVEFSITPTPQKLVPPLVVEFSHLSVNFSNPVCGFWNFSIPYTPNGAWSTVGSRLVRSNDLSTVCEFDHTTNFAVLMSPGRTPVSHMLALSVISAVGCGISLLSLIVTLIVYGVLWRYMNSDRGKSDKAVDRAIILINLCTALIVSYVLFLAGIKQTGNKTTCTSIAVMLHYIFLVDFSLMLAEGVEIAFSVLHVFSTKSRIRWMLPICWFGPVIVVIISASITKLDGYGTPKFCWLSLDSGLLWAFAGPALLIIMINFVILVLVIRTSLRTHLMKEKSKAEKTKAEISNICVLLPLFGLTWVFGILSVNDESVVFQYLFAILNSLQGFFIFVVHCFLDKRVRKGIEHISRKRKSQQLDSSALFQRLKAPSSKNETSTSYLESTKSTSLQHHDSTIEVKTNHNEVTKEESKNNPESTKEWNESHDEATKEANNKLHVSTKEANKHQVSNHTNTNPNDSADDPSVNNIESNTETRLTDNEKKDTTKIDNRTSQVLITDNRDIRTSARPGVNKKNYAKRDITFDDIDENNTASESKHGNKIQRLTSKTTKKRAVSQIKGSSKKSKTQRYSKETSIDTKTRIQSVRHPGTAPDFGDYPSYRSYHRGMWDVSPEEFYGYQQFGQTSSRNLYMPPFTDNKRRPNHRYGHNQPEFEWNAA